MKFKVFYRTVGAPLLLTGTILWPPFDRVTFRLFLVVGIAIGLMIRAFLSKKKYLTDLLITNDLIEVRFMTSLGKSEIFHVRVNDIKELRLSLEGFHHSALGILNLKAGEMAYSFSIISKTVLELTKQQITAAPAGFKKTGLHFYLSSVKHEAAGMLK